jgi:hypothetical protein
MKTKTELQPVCPDCGAAVGSQTGACTKCEYKADALFFCQPVDAIQYTGEVLHGYIIRMKPNAAWRKELLAQTPPDCEFTLPDDKYFMADGKKFHLFPSRNEAVDAYHAKEHDFTTQYDVYIEEVQITTSVIDTINAVIGEED